MSHATKNFEVSPGRFLGESILVPAGITATEAAKAMGVAETVVLQLLAEKQRVTPDLAHRLAAVFGISVSDWLSMQSAQDLKLNPPVIPGSLTPLEPFYWGKVVARFEQSIPWDDTPATCLVTCAFTDSGRLSITLAKRDFCSSPRLTMSVEHHAAAAMLTLLRLSDVPQVVDFGGLEFFRARVRNAYAALTTAESKHLEEWGNRARLDWFEYYLIGPGGTSCTPLHFYQNNPSGGTCYLDSRIEKVMSANLRKVIHEGLDAMAE